ncbi:hypothetical protein ACFQI3_04985 [Hansschlegelia quercus]|uniref:Uncharacterized protein n=1 Tax=Hansschlegelia quercus TaxID=2528245 RepID=A0A4Q9GLK0_9HYPH|nr:hypothetical protein [Hansschlegelia quercus]TBN55223.1 hypothetical protein EYR15_03580 [Hansschlegelia quercus]
MSADSHPRTSDGRYFVVNGRLWRLSNPNLPAAARARLVAELMAARRAVRDANGCEAALKEARARVDIAKVALGERGPVWWTDGAPDVNRKMARNTPYAAWFASLPVGEKKG